MINVITEIIFYRILSQYEMKIGHIVGADCLMGSSPTHRVFVLCATWAFSLGLWFFPISFPSLTRCILSDLYCPIQ